MFNQINHMEMTWSILAYLTFTINFVTDFFVIYVLYNDLMGGQSNAVGEIELVITFSASCIGQEESVTQLLEL